MPARDRQNFKLGLFVFFTLSLFVALVLSLGIFESFQPQAELVTLFDESVQGLTNGSAVKYQGVPLGTVTSINIDMDTQSGRRLIRAGMTIDLQKFKTGAKETISEEHFQEIIRRDIARGLRCTISPDGITGMKFIDLEFVSDPAPDPLASAGAAAVADTPEVLYVPSVPSMLKDLRTSIFALLDKMNAIDFSGISKHTIATLDSVQKRLNDPALARIITNLDKASANLETTSGALRKTLTPEQINGFVQHLNDTIRTVDELSAFAKKTLADAELGKTSDDFRRLLATLNELSRNFSTSLTSLDEMLDSATELIQYLDSDPSALVRGKGKKK